MMDLSPAVWLFSRSLLDQYHRQSPEGPEAARTSTTYEDLRLLLIETVQVQNRGCREPGPPDLTGKYL